LEGKRRKVTVLGIYQEGQIYYWELDLKLLPRTNKKRRSSLLTTPPKLWDIIR